MIDPELKAELERIEAKVDKTYKETHRMWMLAMWGAIITVLLILLPILIIPFLIGPLLSGYSAALSF